MAGRFVDEYAEEMCDLCHEFKYGVFVSIHNKHICNSCCEEINKKLQIFEIENE